MEPILKENSSRSFSRLEEENIARLRLIRCEMVGPLTFYDLVRRFGSASAALEVLPSLAHRGGRPKPLCPPSRETVLEEVERVDRFGAHLIFYDDPLYPPLLKFLPDAPPVLTVKGDLTLIEKPLLGLVGARNASLNGRKFAELIARDMGKAGYGIVSGFARGIDAQAHAGALSTGTLAVMAGGIDVIYPLEHTLLYRQIAEKGLIVAESPFGVAPQSSFFPRRNRLISGLSLGLVVVEAALKSGSLITARYALEQNRDVFAVPGSPFDPRCQGTNLLIAQGATLVQTTEDILRGLPTGHTSLLEVESLFSSPFAEETTPSGEESSQEDSGLGERILTNLSYTPSKIDELIRACGAPLSKVLSVLLELELAGKLHRQSGNTVVLRGNEE